MEGNVKFNVGCGKRNFGSGWFHVDGNTSFLHVNHHDITLSNEPDNYIDLLYISHMIAYMSRDEAFVMLSIWFNKIKPGGTIRIATPDFDILSKFYQVGLDLDRLVGPLYGAMLMNHTAIYHKTTYDLRSLTALLESTGFMDARRYDHTKTEHPNTGGREDFFDDHSAAYINGTLTSLNVEATKPL